VPRKRTAKGFVAHINEVLKPRPTGPLVLDLFAGCGGLALGFEAQGFETLGYEMSADACATYEHNLKGKCINTKLTPDFKFPRAQVVIGGPPCQPFSVGGHQHGIKDSRDGFPIFISAVAQAKPELFIIENVRGLMYRNHWYLLELIVELEKLGYIVKPELLNAVNFGVPQNRERVIIVGRRPHLEFTWPSKLDTKVTAGEALQELALEAPVEGKYLTSSMDAYVAKYEKASNCITPRDLHLDRPARTVTCRNLGGATGDMHRVRLPDGRRRRLTVREGARLQSFPDWFKFAGAEGSQYEQIGNAVAPLFAYALAGAVRQCLEAGQLPTAKAKRHLKSLPLPIDTIVLEPIPS
jgi:DNA (cytosine-5)-methyltransferase 1